MPLQRMYVINVSEMKQQNIAGLVGESLTLTVGQDSVLGALGAKRRALLSSCYDKMTMRLGVDRSKPESRHLVVADDGRNGSFSEASSAISNALKSTVPARRAAGETLNPLVGPLKGVNKMPYLDQSAQLDLLKARYEANPAFAEAAATLGLTDVFAKLWADNDTVKSLYAQRLSSIAADSPAPSSVKSELVHAYNDFCLVVAQTLDALPTPELQALFTKLNELRKKYASTNAEVKAAPASAEGKEQVDTLS